MSRVLVLCLLLVSLSLAVQVTLYRNQNFSSGTNLNGQQCVRISDDDKKKAQSIQIDQGACVILFEKNDCTGRGVVVSSNVNWCAQPRASGFDLKSCDFKKKAQSVRLC